MKKKVVLIGWDAADWEIINPMLKAGKLPALDKLMKRGVHGNLSTMNPPYSPMLWTSIATGKTPDKHGVLGFLELDTENQQIRPVTVTQRKVKSLWNILHNQGLKSNLVGWWPSHPAEPINGVVVSDQFPRITAKLDEEWPVPKGSVHPESLAKEIADLRVHPMELTAAHILPFIPDAKGIDQDRENSLKILTKIIADNSTLHACSTWLMENTEWDFMGIYYDMIDHICHGFMKFHPPKMPQVPQGLFDRYKDVVEAGYRYQDMMLERTLKLAGEDALVIVMSDHGFVSDETRMLTMPDIHAAPALDHREFGMFVASGPGIKQGQRIFGTSMLDITPTILEYLGIPVGEDMDGMVMKDIFTEPKESKSIPSWEQVEGEFGEHDKIIQGDVLSEQSAMEQLIELGYVDRPDADIEKAIAQTKCDIQFNLGRVYMGKGEYDQAEKIFVDLLKEDAKLEPILIDLIQLMIIRKNFDRASGYLGDLRKLNPEAINRTKLMEAKILIGRGQPGPAKMILEQAARRPVMVGPVHYEIGKMLMVTEEYTKALEHFKKAVASNVDHAKYQHALATCYLRLDEPEMSLDHALTSIELVRYFPDAHFTLGQALEQLGELEQAKNAYATAEKLRPKAVRAKIARENIEIADPELSESHRSGSELKEIIVVSGLPRSGTSMMMQMLNAAKVPILTDGLRIEDSDNPKGYFEYEKIKSLHKSNDWLEEAEGKAMKVIAQLLKHLPPTYRYKVIFMTRDINEVVASQAVMLKNHSRRPKEGIKKAFEEEINRLERWNKKEPGVELLRVPYSGTIEDPRKQAESVAEFLNRKLDIEEMVNAVDVNLYRNRVFNANANKKG
ncbi:MAG: putative AlkP superfamily phosphohydrolase/phosphomutase/tetratricopeptide (TPR) repeat protein [Flavobacteriaceae bacterium]|jgi:predicted AlkP superfamily phosphohydrolase/phosphomutase/tetratricopeptide (TPR) repeat protein